MRQYNVFQAIPMSFYSGNLYRDVAQNWGATVFLYLLLILALAWIPLTAQVQTAINVAYTNHSDQIVDQVPVLTIKNGQLSTPEKRPYFITSEDGKERIAVIDTTGQYTTNEQAQAPLLLTIDSVSTQTKPNETRINKIPTSFNMVVEPKKVNQYVKDYVRYLWIFLFIFFLFFSFIYRIIQALLYSVIGLIFNSICQSQLTYGQIFKIMLVAITPVIVVSTVLDFFAVSFHGQNWCYFLLALAYLFFGISVNKEKGAT